MTEWSAEDDEEKDEQSLADTDADATQQSREADDESLADTEGDITLIQEDRYGEDD